MFVTIVGVEAKTKDLGDDGGWIGIVPPRDRALRKLNHGVSNTTNAILAITECQLDRRHSPVDLSLTRLGSGGAVAWKGVVINDT